MRTLTFGILLLMFLFSADGADKDAGYLGVPHHDARHHDVGHQHSRVQTFILDTSSYDVHSAEQPDTNTDIELALLRGHGNTKQRGTGEFECPTACTFELRPVCGSDEQTYDNSCLLRSAACRQQKRIDVEKEGRC